MQTFKTKLNSAEIYIVIDKHKHLPSPRQIVHTSRSKRTEELNSLIPHGSEYTACLCTQDFKLQLIDIITTKFILMAQETITNMIIDSPSIDNPVYIHGHNITSLTSNQHVEADYCIWHHTIHCRIGATVLESYRLFELSSFMQLCGKLPRDSTPDLTDICKPSDEMSSSVNCRCILLNLEQLAA